MTSMNVAAEIALPRVFTLARRLKKARSDENTVKSTRQLLRSNSGSNRVAAEKKAAEAMGTRQMGPISTLVLVTVP